ncbi:MAG: selenide, water dikinase SelD [Oligoflexia bacterium]|nr:selenide, water dikinase SelD [Oligoflexia bacterium]
MCAIRLTQTVQKGGCAAKVAATELRRILERVRFPARHPELLVDGSTFDDAAIYRVSPELALVQTIDFFTPIVDDPYTFGRVAACNALSDVYAMGGRPVTAMAVLAFPLASFESETVAAILQGASDMIAEAGANFVGGHSIDDDTLKFGLSVTGYVHPDRVWSNQGARAGDRLILTKPIGTGTLMARLKYGEGGETGIPGVREAIESMATLNNVVDLLSPGLLGAVHAATDITGFGLSGHAWQMARASGTSFRFGMDRVPVFEGARVSIEEEFLTKAHRTNREYTAAALEDATLAPWQKTLIHDPQTSGGLLLSVAPEAAAELVAAIRPRFSRAEVVGEVVASEGTTCIFFDRNLPGTPHEL